MTVSITKPSVGGSVGVWGTLVNAALDAIVAEVNAQEANVEQDVAAVVTASGGLISGKHNPCDATSGSLSMTIGNATAGGQTFSVEKTDATVNTVGVTLNLRVAGSSTITMVWPNESLEFVSKADGSWWPIAGHKTKGALDAAYATGGLTPAQHKLFNWSFSPVLASAAGTACATGKVTLVKIPWPTAQTVKNYWYSVNTVGAGLTAAQNLMALYTGAGVLITGTTSPDQSTNFTVLGLHQATLAVAKLVPVDPTGFIYAAFLTVGTTPPIFRGQAPGITIGNAGLLTTDAQNFGQDASSTNTTMPGTITLTTMTQVNPLFVAIGP